MPCFTVHYIQQHLYYYTKMSSSVKNNYLTFLLYWNILKMKIEYCKSYVMNWNDTRFLMQA